jgi:hypothetical protein
MMEARNTLANALTPYGKIQQVLHLTGIDEPQHDLLVNHPLAMFWYACHSCRHFWDFFCKSHGTTPSSDTKPWHLLIYADEICPGDAFKPQPTRKIQAVYFSFLEFGPMALTREDAWFNITDKRSCMMHDIAGGMSQLFGSILKLCFPQHGSNLSDGGIVLNHPGCASIRLFAKIGVFVQDGGAHKITWHARGDAGTKMCILCRNIFAEDSGLPAEDGENLLCSRVILHSGCDLATNEDIIGSVIRMDAAKLTDSVDRFRLRQQVIGFTWHPYNIISDPDLRGLVNPADQLMHDWMHGMICSGVMNTTFHLLLEALRSNGCTRIYDLFNGYIEQFNWPWRVRNKNLHSLFDENRREGNRKARSFRCQASEMLSLYPVAAMFVTSTILPTAGCDDECLAFLACCDLLDAFTSIPRGRVSPNMLASRVERFLGLFNAVWGYVNMQPKFHWLLHYARCLSRFGTLISCFVHERKHRTIKRYAADILNTTNYEKSLLSEATCQHLYMLSLPETFNFSVGLVRPTKASKKVQDLLRDHFGTNVLDVSSSAESRISEYATCHKTDVVLYKSDDEQLNAGVVLAHLDVEGDALSIISCWDRIVVRLNDSCADFQYARDRLTMVYTDTIIDAVTWTMVRDGVVRVILPTSFTIG